MKISIQGIPGSFHHQVALNCFGEEAEILGFRTFEEAAKCVSKGECEFGILAIENSIALGNFDNQNSTKAMCEMELLFQSDELKKHFE
jgi:hypothetical protein